MKSNVDRLVTNIQHQIAKIVGGLLVIALAWQIVILPGDIAIASPLLATSTNSMSKQVTGKAEQLKGSATESIAGADGKPFGKMQSGIENRQQAIQMKAKDDLNEGRIEVGNSNARVKNAAEKGTAKVKTFFGQ